MVSEWCIREWVKSFPFNKHHVFSIVHIDIFLGNLNMAEMKFIFEMVKTLLGKGENAGCQHLLLFPQCFSNVFLMVYGLDYLDRSLPFTTQF